MHSRHSIQFGIKIDTSMPLTVDKCRIKFQGRFMQLSYKTERNAGHVGTMENDGG
jgi:hypothetical protein